jgi:hypothetical protein
MAVMNINDVTSDIGIVLDFGAMWFCRTMPTFQRNMLSPSSGLKAPKPKTTSTSY